MVTIIKIGGALATNIVELSGLSTDEKPIEGITNGSKFEEIDTGDTYMYDAENSIWIKQ